LSANRSAAHSALKHAIKLAMGARPDVRLFDNPRGNAKNPETGARLTFGLAPGASDIVGIVKPRGRWLALEVKTGEAESTREQAAFLDMVNNFGGVGRVVRSVADAEAAVDEAHR
jgi:hypothetical protein